MHFHQIEETISVVPELLDWVVSCDSWGNTRMQTERFGYSNVLETTGTRPYLDAGIMNSIFDVLTLSYLIQFTKKLVMSL